jgi:enoyl-CoA hydratase/carnithine racemase
MWATLQAWCEGLPEKVRVLILRGRPGEFSAGSDIKEFAMLSPGEANQAFMQMEAAISALERLPIPTIAVIDGPAFGAAFVLTLACDLRIGSHLATFGMPVGKLGITLQPPFLKRLVQHLGPGRTKELVYTAAQYDAREARRFGLLNAVTSPEDLDNYVIRVARTILQQSPASLHAVKVGVHRVLNQEPCELGTWVDEVDFMEGVRAFTEKRAAQFRTLSLSCSASFVEPCRHSRQGMGDL